MLLSEYFVVFPDGDIQEVPGRLPIDELVDLNGSPLPLPLTTNRVIAYRVNAIRVVDERGSSTTYHRLELVSAAELSAYVRR